MSSTLTRAASNPMPTTIVPDLMQNLFDYSSGTVVVYAGYAPMGAATTDDNWTIFLYSYDGNNNVTSKQTWLGKWSQRTVGNYT